MRNTILRNKQLWCEHERAGYTDFLISCKNLMWDCKSCLGKNLTVKGLSYNMDTFLWEFKKTGCGESMQVVRRSCDRFKINAHVIYFFLMQQIRDVVNWFNHRLFNYVVSTAKVISIRWNRKMIIMLSR